MHFAYLLSRLDSLRELKAAHAAATTTGFAFLRPAATITSLLQSLTLLRPLPPKALSLPYALSLFGSLPHPASTLAHNLLIRLLLSAAPSSAHSALRLFSRLRRLSLPPDLHSFPLALSASSRLRLLPLGRALHAQSLRFGFSRSLFLRNALISLYSSCAALIDAEHVFLEKNLAVDVVSYNTLIHGYANAGEINSARHLFDVMPHRDQISWGTVIAGYSRSGRCVDALRLFDEMQAGGFEPDNAALVSALSCCAQLGLLERGRAIHDRIGRARKAMNAHLLTALVDMYAKCGAINAAVNLFDVCPCKNQFTWNTVIVGLAMHGHGVLSLEYFDKMQTAGVRPDGVTFLGVLVACSHSGFVETARKFFGEMEAVHAVPRELKHYGCMSDLLGRAGFIGEAMEMIEEMPVKGDAYVWGGVLAGCRNHRGNVDVAEIAARHLLELNPGDSGVYSIVAGIYADAGRWADVARIRSSMDAMKVKRNVALSFVQQPWMGIGPSRIRLKDFELGDKLASARSVGM
ncbi:Pentatricopeptide repeat-containing protein [Platanthera guangdongensis]|uniref:Pentatricopeptide repeat-containing protein n=1 Tax=Platanthera guangdongensis TaxID=2320717 RepID=A0ABR2N3S8_9ASPA